ncbi:MAG: DUF86 domain-containing protein [Nanoarchaeota archaeon]
MTERIQDKIAEIETFWKELEEIIPDHLDQYFSNFLAKAACERYFEKIIEAIVDLSFLIIKHKQFKIPEEDKEAFEILSQEGIISELLSDKLKAAKGMRNILAHEYGKVDDELIYLAISDELQNDVLEFLKDVKKII